MRFKIPSRFWLAGVAVVLGAQSAAAQSGALTGLVTSAETNSSLVAAVVQVLNTDGGRVASTLTNQTGRFQIANLPAGTYIVTVSTTGHATGRQEAVEVGAGQTTTVDFLLPTRAFDLDPVVVSASRGEERSLDAPARTEVVSPQIIQERPVVQPTEHLRGISGVDIVSQGLQSTNVVTRGFNNVFSAALLALTDHRIAAIPSLRVNALYMIPNTNEDIDRMEVVLGPGSALYGPNSANGVLHIFTRSPLTYQGSTVALTGGERRVFQGSARTAQLLADHIGLKVSGQYFRGDEWEYTDPVEATARAAAMDPQTRIGLRDFDSERWSADARVDYRLTPGATAIFSGGRSTTVKGIELTGVGAAQIRNWTYDYFQARFNTGGLFAQAYLNMSSAGETYLLREGRDIVDDSRFYVGQVQHAVTPLAWQSFTYGADYLGTRPDTKGTIHGRFEDQDDYNEIGAFLQSSTTLGRRFDVILAGRVDRHSVVDEYVFSPRAALVFKPAETQSLRASFNRAYSNPGSVQLFLDLHAGPVPGPLGPLGYTARAQGTGREGISFQQPDGSYVMRSPFAADRTAFQDINVSNLWQMQVRGFAGAAAAQGQLTPQQAQLFVQFMAPQIPIGASVAGLDPVTQTVGAFVPPGPVAPIREENVTTYEVGYQGILGGRLLVAADVWHAQRDNFISALTPQSPLVLVNPQEMIAHATPRIQAFLMAGGMPLAQAQATAAVMAQIMAQIPGGVVSAPSLTDGGADLLVSYQNFGDIDLWGTDVSVMALLTEDWTLSASTSLVSDDHFRTEGRIVTLNAPSRKGIVALAYRNETNGLNAEARVRYTDGFPVNSGAFIGLLCIEPESRTEDCVKSHTLADLTVGYRVRQLRGASVQLTIQNLFDTGYRSFVGVPEIGRLAMVRLRYDL